MSTKDASKNNHHSFTDNFGDTQQRYSNLNLNQQQFPKSSNISSIHSYNKTKDCKQWDSTIIATFNNNEKKDLSQSWNKSCMTGLRSKAFNPTTIVNDNDDNEGQEVRKRWKKGHLSPNTTSSTLSLHIAAYENSVQAVAAVNSANDGRKISTKKKDIKDEEDDDAQIGAAAAGMRGNSFEFSRQQKDTASPAHPEIMKFKTSQQLLNHSPQQENQLTKMLPVTTAHEKSPPTNDRLPAINEYIIKRYLVKQIIGDGGYGTVLSVIDEVTKKNYAIKTEKYSRSMLPIEVAVLRAAREQKCKHFAQLIDQGSVRREYVFIVMTLLGRDLHKLRNDQPQRHFTPVTAIRTGIQTLEALKELHELGFISRDVKPGNFVIGRDEEQTTIFLIDFGLARKYCNKDGSVIPTRGEVGWRGTARYGSIQAHLRQDLGRKDDIESWFYMSIELYKGALPWRLVVDRAQIHAQKMEHRTKCRKSLFEGCPNEYNYFLKEIDLWKFEDKPKYDEFLQILNQMLKKYGTEKAYIPYDWEDSTSSQRNSLSMSDKAQRRIEERSAEPAD